MSTLKDNSVIVLAGCAGSGKTEFILKMLANGWLECDNLYYFSVHARNDPKAICLNELLTNVITDGGFVSDNVNDLYDLQLDATKKNLVIIDEFPKADISKIANLIISRKVNNCSIIFTCQSEKLCDLPTVVRSKATFVFTLR